jgi:acetyl-CoA acyltransferase
MLGFAVAGVDPKYMGLGPIAAVPKAMERAGMKVEDMDVIELNEAFASQAIACVRDLHLDMDKVNPYGGAMALGHPMGATGIFLTCKALDYLRDNDKKYGLVTMCIGGGMGGAGIFERLN